MWFPVEAPEGHVAVVSQQGDHWMLWGKRFEDEMYIFFDSLPLSCFSQHSKIVEWAEKRIAHKGIGVEATCNKIPGWKPPDWELDDFHNGDEEDEPDSHNDGDDEDEYEYENEDEDEDEDEDV